MRLPNDSDGALPGRERSFLSLMVLSLITLTAYFYYWLYINLKELKEGPLRERDSVIHKARTWYWIKIVLLPLVGSLSVVLTVPESINDLNHIEFSPALLVFTVAAFTVNVIFFYYFVVSVSEAQAITRLVPFDVTITFSLYLISLLIDLLSGIYVLQSGFVSAIVAMSTRARVPGFSSLSPLTFLGFFSVVKIVLWLICIYQVQSAINRIWHEGTSAA